MMSVEDNPCWGRDEPDLGELLPGWEPGEDEDHDDDVYVEGMCAYCGAEPWRWNQDRHGQPCEGSDEPRRDPFGGRIVCKRCFDQIIGGDDG